MAKDYILLEEAWLSRLLSEIEASDFCFVCNNHPSHGHDDKCPIKLYKDENN